MDTTSELYIPEITSDSDNSIDSTVMTSDSDNISIDSTVITAIDLNSEHSGPTLEGMYNDDIAAMTAIEAYCKHVGFGYTISSSNYKNGVLKNKRVACYCHRNYKSKKKAGSRKYASTTRLTDCPWKLYLKYESDCVRLTVLNSNHNHGFCSHPNGKIHEIISTYHNLHNINSLY